jgi:Fe-S-cluster containining protein
MRDDRADGDPPECLACGACCFSTLTTYVSVTGDDYARLGDDAAGLVSWDSNHAYMRLEDGHCAALRVDPIERRFVCTMYETRPQVCRDLARGPGACAGERQSKEERPLLALHGR